MKERPILFSGAMVRAILDGSMTQTRRFVKGEALRWLADGFTPEFVADYKNKLCPYGQPGDRLWVRETWARDSEDDALFYRADVGSGNEADEWQRNIDDGANGYRWRPSIHMPRDVSRITLEVTGVRVERLQEIGEVDARAEGAPWAACSSPQVGSHKAGFAQLWEGINGAESWSANPWVWVIEFEVVK